MQPVRLIYNKMSIWLLFFSFVNYHRIKKSKFEMKVMPSCLFWPFYRQCRWFSARLQYLQCVSNRDTAVLCRAVDMILFKETKTEMSCQHAIITYPFWIFLHVPYNSTKIHLGLKILIQLLNIDVRRHVYFIVPIFMIAKNNLLPLLFYWDYIAY